MTNDDHYPSPEVERSSLGAGVTEVVIRNGNPVVALKCDGCDVAYLSGTFLGNAIAELESTTSHSGLRECSI